MLQVSKCYWPGDKVSQRIKRQELPDIQKWKLYDIKVFAYTGTINYYIILVTFNKVFGKITNTCTGQAVK
jgi:hypothetical protein